MKKGMKIHNLKRILSAAVLLAFVILLTIYEGKHVSEKKNINEAGENIKGNQIEKEIATKITAVKTTTEILEINNIGNENEEWEMSEREGEQLSEIVDAIQTQQELEYYNLWNGKYYERFSEMISGDERETLEEYLPVLRGEEEIHCACEGDGSVEEYIQDGHKYFRYPHMKSMTLEEWVYSLFKEEYRRDWLWEIAFMDMDGDGEQEMVMCTMNDIYILVLHRENDKVYGIDFGIRCFNSIQENGIHTKSGGAGSTFYYSIFFEDGMFIEKELGGREYPDYYVGIQQVTEEEYEQWREKVEQTAEQTEWYETESYEERNKEQIPSAYEQLETFAYHVDEWKKGEDIKFCIYDFDQDGMLELLVSSKKNNQYAENHFYHAGGDHVVELEQNYYGEKGDEFDLEWGNRAWCDPSTGRISYYAQNNSNINDSLYWNYYGYFCLEDGCVENIPVCSLRTRCSKEGIEYNYYNMTSFGLNGYDLEEIDKNEFDALKGEYHTDKVEKYVYKYWVTFEENASQKEILFDLILSYQKGKY